MSHNNLNFRIRGRRNSGDTPTKVSNEREPIRDWMTKQNRALPLISPVARYDPPTICLDKDESLVDDDLHNGPGFERDEDPNGTINDLLDSLDNTYLNPNLNPKSKPRRDTDIFHKQIMVRSLGSLYNPDDLDQTRRSSNSKIDSSSFIFRSKQKRRQLKRVLSSAFPMI